MSRDSLTNVPASIRARLKNKADATGISFNQILQYYAMERFLFRLSRTRWADALVVKGATMLRVWDGAVARPTRDIDFSGRMDTSPDSIETMIQACFDVVAEDGLEFSREVTVEPITVEERYPGARAVIRGSLSGARITLQLDIGVAYATFPEPGWVDYPTLLDMEAPRILAYRPSTAVAEKFQAMVEKALLNSRMKDYYDIWMLSTTVRFDGAELRDALRTTFDQRGTDIPGTPPPALRDEFTVQPIVRDQWASFVRRLRASRVDAPDELEDVVEQVSRFIMPVATSLAETGDESLGKSWEPDQGWVD